MEFLRKIIKRGKMFIYKDLYRKKQKAFQIGHKNDQEFKEFK